MKNSFPIKDKTNELRVNIADVWYDIFPVRNGKNRPYNEMSIKLLDSIVSDTYSCVFGI